MRSQVSMPQLAEHRTAITTAVPAVWALGKASEIKAPCFSRNKWVKSPISLE